MLNRGFEITHFLVRKPDPKIWVKLVCVKREIGISGPYFLGLELRPFSENQLKSLDHLCELETPWQIYTKSKCFWLTPKKEIWLANEKNPTRDSNKLLLVTLNQRRDYKRLSFF